MRAATEGHLPPVMHQGNLVEPLCCEARKGSPGELMVESSSSCQRKQASKEMSDEAADAAALTYLLTYLLTVVRSAVVTVTKAKVRSRTIKVPWNGCIQVLRHLSTGGTRRIPPRAGNDLAPPVDHGIEHERMPAVGWFVEPEQLPVYRVRR